MSRRQYVCPNCGSVGRPIGFKRGATVVEAILWLVFTVPGLLGLILLALAFCGIVKVAGEANIPPGQEGIVGTVIGGAVLLQALLASLCVLYSLPGFLYSFARMTTKYEGCPFCEAPNMVPIDTPRGRQLLKQVDYGAK
jgi:hypothetical protein